MHADFIGIFATFAIFATFLFMESTICEHRCCERDAACGAGGAEQIHSVTTRAQDESSAPR